MSAGCICDSFYHHINILTYLILTTNDILNKSCGIVMPIITPDNHPIHKITAHNLIKIRNLSPLERQSK